MRPPDRREGSTRRDPHVLLIVAALLLVARIAAGVREARHPVEPVDRVAWRPIAGATVESRRLQKPILYDFTAEWCAPCRLMQREVFGDPAAARAIASGFVPVRVLDRKREDGRNPPEVDSLQARYAIDGFPTLVVVPADGSPPTKLDGYGGKDETMRRLARLARPAVQGTIEFHREVGSSGP